MSSLEPSPRKFSAGPLRGTISIPGDKSISHRALIVGAYSREPVGISNLNPGRDVRATMEALIALGARVEGDANRVSISAGRLREPIGTLDCMNSGSTARMMLGVCAGADIRARFDGDESLRRRPMEPVAAQLRAFGATIDTTEGLLPLEIHGTETVQTRRFILLGASAQIKSALLFAGLFGHEPIAIEGDRYSRDHTERLLHAMGADISWDGRRIEFRSDPKHFAPIEIAGDASAAAFFITAATVARGSKLRIENVGVNPTRMGLIDALRQMGARIALLNERAVSGEPVADIVVEHAPLRGIGVGPDLAIRAIDEIPLLAVAAAFADGETKITGIRELRTKESDRVAAIERLLQSAGVEVETLPNGIRIVGGKPHATDTVIATHDDHRTAMAAAVLATEAGSLAIDSDASIDVSFPSFIDTLRSVQNA